MTTQKAPNINLAVGRSCFVQCSGCYNHFASNPNLISNEEILRFLTFAKGKGVSNVTYCGGDPLSRPWIVELLSETKRLGFGIKVDTVGTPLLNDADTIFFGRNNVEKIEVSEIHGFVDQFGIPLDGADERTIALFRKGREGLLAEQLDILRCLTQAGCKVSINTVVTKQNADDLIGIGSLINSVSKNASWDLFQFSPSGPFAFKSRNKFEIQDKIFSDRTGDAKHHMRTLCHQGRVSAMSSDDRANLYLLVDSDGEAWQPMCRGQKSDETPDAHFQKHVVGNIRDENCYDCVVAAVLTSHACRIAHTSSSSQRGSSWMA